MRTLKNLPLLILILVFLTGFRLEAQTLSKLQIGRAQLLFELDTKSGAFLIKDSKRNREWRSVGYKKIAFLGADVSGEQKIKMSLYDSTSKTRFSGSISFDSDSSVSFAVDTDTKDAGIDQLAFPPAITTNYNKGYLTFCYRSGGLLLSQHDTSYPVKRMMVYDNIGLDMPWIGVFDNEKGDGMMLLAETPDDVEIDLYQQNGRMWPNVAWAPSLSKFAYSRKATYIFTSAGRYVSLAKTYRTYLQQSGDFKTLAQKAVTKPGVHGLKGAAVVWGSKGLTFARQANAAGVKRCVVMGQFKPDDLLSIAKLGYITSNYENLEGTREGPMGFMKDTMEIAGYRTKAGKPIIGWVTEKGIEYYSRSSVRSLAALKKYMPTLLKQFPFTGRFLDVTPAFLLEDFHPAHTFSRLADKEYKLQAMKYLGSDLGLVLGGEHGKAWNASALNYLEGPMTGSFFWDDGNKPGYLVPPKDSTYASPSFKKYGADFRSRIPLWQLVFNDCVSSTWYWGDSNDWFTAVTPVVGEQKDLMNILYGTMPLLWADNKGYGWERNRSRFLQTLRNVCYFQERVAFSELLTHRFLGSDHNVQHSTFAGGAEAFINLAGEPVVQTIGSKEVVLAPRGFYAVASGFVQSKTMEKGSVVTRIISDSLYCVETAVRRRVGAITTKGWVSVFKIGERHWRIVMETPESETEINLNAITKGNQARRCQLYVLDTEGNRTRRVGKVYGNNIRLQPGNGIRLYDVTWD